MENEKESPFFDITSSIEELERLVEATKGLIDNNIYECLLTELDLLRFTIKALL